MWDKITHFQFYQIYHNAHAYPYIYLIIIDMRHDFELDDGVVWQQRLENMFMLRAIQSHVNGFYGDDPVIGQSVSGTVWPLQSKLRR